MALLAISLCVQSDLRTQYNKAEDRTNISTKTRQVKGADLYAFFYLNHKGQQLSEPVAHIAFVIDSTSRDWKYLKPESRRLFVLADGERFNIDGDRSDSDVHSTYSRVLVNERLIFALTVDQLKRIGNAKSVEFQLGNDRFTLPDKTLKDAREMLARINTQP